MPPFLREKFSSFINQNKILAINAYSEILYVELVQSAKLKFNGVIFPLVMKTNASLRAMVCDYVKRPDCID